MHIKRIIPFVLLSMLMACGDRLTEQVQLSYDNGQPRYIRYYTKTGECVKEAEYYENGKVKMMGKLSDGHREGEWKSFFENGNPQSVGYFVNGLRDGKSCVYSESGSVMMEGQYCEGKMTGVWKYYDEKGTFLREIDYGDRCTSAE